MTPLIPTIVTATIRITRIRAVNKRGCIAFGHRVDVKEAVNDRSSAIVLTVPSTIAGSKDVVVGGIYEAYGEAQTLRREHGGFVIMETNIVVHDLKLIRPSGSQVIQWMSDNVTGIREVKATKLWDVFGEGLYDVLDQSNHDSVIGIIPSEVVRCCLFSKWSENGDARTLRFVQEKNIPLDLARKIIRFHKTGTISALTEDPYRLLSFAADWQDVDRIALQQFGMTADDPRRTRAALEEALYRISEKGHTCATLADLQKIVAVLIRPHKSPNSALSRALLSGKEIGQFVVRQDASGEVMLHAPGTWIMERECAEFIRSLLQTTSSHQQLFPTDIDDVLRRFESEERDRLGRDDFSLNDAQRKAVRTSFAHRFSIITGGAGVGKTTVLKALYRALDTLGRPRFQMALSGRATARMIEATSESATTIAGFLSSVSAKEIGMHPIVVIDEASMLDLVTFYRLARKLPRDTHLILVGDPYQLPPIGAGLVLHVLCGHSEIAQTQLTEVKRQSKASEIPSAAQAIREGRWPDFTSNEAGEVILLPTSDAEIIPTVLRLYEQKREGTQILCATRSCRFAGVDALNRTCHVRYASHGRPLLAFSAESGQIESTGFCVGDLLLYTANDWQRGLQNGCLGQLTEVYDDVVQVNIGTVDHPVMRGALGCAVYEGIHHYVLESDLDAMQHAYAITVHKSQGSQFQRVIIPVRQSRILDRTFVYTALTRAQVQVILVGDVAALKQAIALPPKAFSRQVALDSMLSG